MSFKPFVSWAENKARFASLEDYLGFARAFVRAKDGFVEAIIRCQNEPSYRFLQLSADVDHAISRPFNNELFCTAEQLDEFESVILPALANERSVRELPTSDRSLLNRAIYTMQQTIGISLDGLPAKATNKARKINGDLFERLIQLTIQRLGVQCKAASIKVPVLVDGKRECDMSFQHDLVISESDQVKIIGSVKTSSKDRIGKIFVDKMLLNALTSDSVAHMAVFLNDVQRGKRADRSYKVSSTFLPGHFKAYTIKVNPLDGVYYRDLRPNMRTDALLAKEIAQLDYLICEDVWNLLGRSEGVKAEIIPDP